MNHNDRINSIQDYYLQETTIMCAKSAMELLQTTEFRSAVWDVYISGVAYGVWISICDLEFVSLDDVANSINEHVSINLN